jgi:hypothetical protein
MLGTDVKKTSGWIKSVKRGLVNLPEVGWQYSDNGFKEDTLLKFV